MDGDWKRGMWRSSLPHVFPDMSMGALWGYFGKGRRKKTEEV